MQILETTKDKDGNFVPAADKDGKAIVVKEYTSTSDAAGIDISKDVMVNTANEMLSYEPLVPEKKLLKNNSLIKANGMHL